tara:strand:+ start:404 stop:739 length:336 start_codon:yes stop_codon:yes gene_type:complete
MVKTVTNETDFIIKKISSHLKTHDLHALSGEVIPTKRKIGGETVHLIPSLYVPERKIPIELTANKQRDQDYMDIGLLPLVISEFERVQGTPIEDHIDSFLDFHTKWKDGLI